MINLIAAITYYPKEDQFIIAANGKLPHNSPEAMARFMKTKDKNISRKPCFI